MEQLERAVLLADNFFCTVFIFGDDLYSDGDAQI